MSDVTDVCLDTDQRESFCFPGACLLYQYTRNNTVRRIRSAYTNANVLMNETVIITVFVGSAMSVRD